MNPTAASAPGVRWVSACQVAAGPSTAADTPSSGSGGTRDAYASMDRGRVSWLARTITFAAAQAAAAPTVIRMPASVAPLPRVTASAAMPELASSTPPSCAGRSRSPSTPLASSTENSACAWSTSEARPAGIPCAIAVYSRPNFTPPKTSPYATT